MLFKSKAPEKDKNAAANAAEVMGRMVQQQHSVVEQVAASPPVPKAGAGSCIGSDMSIACRAWLRPRYRPSTPIYSALKDGLRSPVLRWRPKLKVLPRGGSQSFGVSSRSSAI
jgi:hypothetical protein